MPGYIKEGKVYIQNYHIIGCLNGYLHKTTFPLKQLKNAIEYLKDIPNTITSSATALFGIITNVALVVFTVPFILFYMFKDGHAFPGKAVSLLPESYREEGLRIIKETNETLSAYIQGQALVCIFVGAFTLSVI